MKFTLSWLKDHLDTDATVDALAEALTDLGLEVEGIEDPTAQLGAFRICRVIEASAVHSVSSASMDSRATRSVG